MVKPIPPKNISDAWPAPNYVNPEIRSHGALLAATITLTTLMMSIVSMRLYVRLIILHTLSWDDFFIAGAAVSTFRRDDTMLFLTIPGLFHWLVYNDKYVNECRMGFVLRTYRDRVLTIFTDRHIWDQQPQWFELSELVRSLPVLFAEPSFK